jgi:predicted enzyme related to lactoylglutathione lyase
MLFKNLNRRDFVRVVGLVGVAGSVGSAVAQTTQAKLSGGKMCKHPVVHFEIGCRDLAATKGFYQNMFDWPIDEQFQIADAGITGHLTSLGHEPQHYTLFYVQVEDVPAAITKAESLGGKKIVGPVKIPTGTFAWIMDTQENVIGLWNPK